MSIITSLRKIMLADAVLFRIYFVVGYDYLEIVPRGTMYIRYILPIYKKRVITEYYYGLIINPDTILIELNDIFD